MKDFNEWLNVRKIAVPVYRAIAKYIRPNGVGNDLHEVGIDINKTLLTACVNAKPSHISLQDWERVLHDIFTNAKHTMGPTWVNAGMYADGVKVFCPSSAECNALANVEINAPISMYRQPFDTFAVVFPEKITPECPDEVRAKMPLVTMAALMRCDLERKSLVITLLNRPSYAGIAEHAGRGLNICWAGIEDDEIEKHLSRFSTNWGGLLESITGNGYTEDLDYYTGLETLHAYRIAINACMLLSQGGAVRVGSTNQSYADKLDRQIKKNVAGESVLEMNIRDRVAIPEIYGLNQHIRVYDVVDANGNEPGSSGERLMHKPHWRRGHWAQQVCGEGWKDRKLIYRRPTFVNGQLFAGELGDTRVSMSLAKKPE